MRFQSIKLRGLIPFPNEVSVDFDAIPGRVVAVCGQNGAGKSTLLEALIGATIPGRKCPTRGTLASLAIARDAHVEIGVVNGRPWTITHDLDAVTSKGESDVRDESGATVLPDKKVRSFDDWARKTLPAPEVMLSSVFAAQKNGGFLSMDPGERKGVILRLRGVERLEKLAEMARSHARDARAELDKLEARIKDERVRGGGDVERAQADLDEARTALTAAEAHKQEADAALEALRAEAAIAREHNDGVRERRAAVAAAEKSRDDSTRRANALTSEIAGLRYGLLEQSDAIRAAADRAEVLDREIAPLREKLAGLRAEQRAADARLTVARQVVARARDTVRHAQAKLREAETQAQKRADAVRDAEALPSECERLARAEAELAAAEARLEELRTLAETGADGRIRGLRDALSDISLMGQEDESVEGAPGVAESAIEADDEAKATLDRIPADRAEAVAARDLATGEIAKLRLTVARLERAAALAEAPDPSEPAREAHRQAEQAVEVAERAETEAKADDERLRTAIVEATATLNERTAERGNLAEAAAKVTELAQAEARVQALSEQLAEAEQDASVAAEAIEELTKSTPEMKLEPDLGAAEQACHRAVAGVVSAGARATDAERALAAARESAERLESLERDRAGRAEELADWTRLGADLGRDGLQAMLVDATGPELTAIANDLLHTCVGPRFTVEIATQYASSDGKKMLEGCEVRVLDTRDGRWKEGQQLSGGEAVIVGESIALALASLACRIWGIEGATLIRDESGAALDVDAAPAYVAMLRRAADAIGVSHILFVTHNEAAAALADARVVVGGGKVEVRV